MSGTATAVVLADGEWAAAFGEVEATHTGEFLGLPGDGKGWNERGAGYENE